SWAAPSIFSFFISSATMSRKIINISEVNKADVSASEDWANIGKLGTKVTASIKTKKIRACFESNKIF
ncbi:MAG: hypothetical protein OEY17_08040, partial [Nitrosopumilus sp.]|nr:hypothetical protein [Nitrosopumilus sp.]